MGNCRSVNISTMGSGITKSAKSNVAEQKVTLAILGLDNAGKTVTARVLQGACTTDVTPTIGFSSVSFTFDRRNITLYDLGGGAKIRGIWQKYYADVHGFVFVIDASDTVRLDECHQVLEDFLSHELVCGKPVLLLANKQDVDGALDEQDICDQLQLEDLANRYKSPCRVETCAAASSGNGSKKKMDPSIEVGMRWLTKLIEVQWPQLSERVAKDVEKKTEAEKMEKQERAKRVQRSRELREEEERSRGQLRDEEDDHEDVDPFKPINQQLLISQKRETANKKKSRKKSRRSQMEELDEKEEDGEVGVPQQQLDNSDGEYHKSLSHRSRQSDVNDILDRHKLEPLDNHHKLESLNSEHRLDPFSGQHHLEPLDGRQKLEAIENRRRLDAMENRYKLEPINQLRHKSELTDHHPYKPLEQSSDRDLNQDFGHRNRDFRINKKISNGDDIRRHTQKTDEEISGDEGHQSDSEQRNKSLNNNFSSHKSSYPPDVSEPGPETNVRRKKKNRKFKLRNHRTSPSPTASTNHTPASSDTDNGPSVIRDTPRKHLSLIKSTQPRQSAHLGRLEENDDDDDQSTSISHKWNLADDLLELPSASSHHRANRPNMDSDDDLVT